MIGTWLAAALLVASVALTYFCCLRPMRRGRCAMTSCMPTSTSPSHEAEVAKLREEIDGLKRRSTP